MNAVTELEQSGGKWPEKLFGRKSYKNIASYIFFYFNEKYLYPTNKQLQGRKCKQQYVQYIILCDKRKYPHSKHKYIQLNKRGLFI